MTPALQNSALRKLEHPLIWSASSSAVHQLQDPSASLLFILPWLLGSSQFSFGFIPRNKCAKFWFYARIKPTIFHNLYVDLDHVLSGNHCLSPVPQKSESVFDTTVLGMNLSMW